MSVKYSVIIPVYNEEKAILETIEGVKRIMAPYPHEIIAVNDGSTDRTREILKSAKGATVLNHASNKGYGSSLKTGIRSAQGEWIIITDADGTYPIADIPKLIKQTPENDMVVGARTGQNVHVPLLRKPAKWILTRVARIATGVDIPDLNSGLRIFRKDMAMKFWSFYPNGFSFTTTITMASLANNYNVKYVPINYFKRKGKSAINPVKDFLGFNFLIFKIALFFAPLKFFIPASALMFMVGIAKGILDFSLTGRIGIAAAVTVLFSIQVFFFGLLADMINKSSVR